MEEMATKVHLRLLMFLLLIWHPNMPFEPLKDYMVTVNMDKRNQNRNIKKSNAICQWKNPLAAQNFKSAISKGSGIINGHLQLKAVGEAVKKRNRTVC